MDYVFDGCSSLEEINLSNFNTNKVIEMKYMFSDCSSLKELNLTNFNTHKVSNMRGMFKNCSSLKKLNIDNFISNKADMREMFEGCSKELEEQAKIKIKYN